MTRISSTPPTTDSILESLPWGSTSDSCMKQTRVCPTLCVAPVFCRALFAMNPSLTSTLLLPSSTLLRGVCRTTGTEGASSPSSTRTRRHGTSTRSSSTTERAVSSRVAAGSSGTLGTWLLPMGPTSLHHATAPTTPTHASVEPPQTSPSTTSSASSPASTLPTALSLARQTSPRDTGSTTTSTQTPGRLKTKPSPFPNPSAKSSPSESTISATVSDKPAASTSDFLGMNTTSRPLYCSSMSCLGSVQHRCDKHDY
mmetsp:Transcript_3517/g.8890  ORF Transcript_3517/g.8890 Transcript_3517/m.8890 type:complete len:256 (+) Transcript_3517:664-1431(+)